MTIRVPLDIPPGPLPGADNIVVVIALVVVAAVVVLICLVAATRLIRRGRDRR